MQVGLVSNYVGKGLQVDAELLRDFLVSLGHEVHLIQFDKPWDAPQVDLGISLEVVVPHFFSQAKRWCYFPNCEWLKPSYIRTAQQFDRIFAKTRDAERQLRSLFANTVKYTGFLSKDKRDMSVPRERVCLHVGGDSGFKNTNAVLAAWREYRYWNGLRALDAPLIVVSSSSTTITEATPGVTFLKHLSEEEVTKLQNSCLFHILPSAAEGYGHSLHEAQSCGAVVLTTRAGAMAELKAPFEVDPVGPPKPNNQGELWTVSGAAIREKLAVMLEQPSQMIARYQTEARARWERDQRDAKEGLARAIGAVLSDDLPSNVRRVSTTPKTAQKRTVAILGNFGPPHSTENDLRWSFEDLGYRCLTFQENETATEDILKGCEGVSLLVYVHTHGWQTPGQMPLDELWKRLQEQGTKTCSFHLDRYWGLDVLDQRETKIGTHPFWRTQCVFTADGGNEDRFRSRGIVHSWLPPGVVRRDCVPGQRREDLVVDVGFVGATGYHPEYPFRGELIEFLKETYGERFRVFQGYRGEALNDVYASVRVVVGDSCFGGSDYYWSDRVPETLGRGGFLLHPACRGLNIPGLATFTPGRLVELADRVDYFLEHERERECLQFAAHCWVRENETYTNRMKTLLAAMEVA